MSLVGESMWNPMDESITCEVLLRVMWSERGALGSGFCAELKNPSASSSSLSNKLSMEVCCGASCVFSCTGEIGE
jgi:hypothetical protein